MKQGKEERERERERKCRFLKIHRCIRIRAVRNVRLNFFFLLIHFDFDSFHCGGIIAGEGGGRKGGKWEWYVVSSSEINI